MRADSTKLPSDLADFYSSFVQAAQSQNIEKIKASILPGISEITTTPRKQNIEYGNDINLPFLKSGFSPKIESISSSSDYTIDIRTSSTSIAFVKTASGKWYIYRYFDKPIE